MLTPFCETDGLFFDSSSEPQTFKKTFDKEIHEFRSGNEEGEFIKTYSRPQFMDEVINSIRVQRKELNSKGKVYIKYKRNIKVRKEED